MNVFDTYIGGEIVNEITIDRSETALLASIYQPDRNPALVYLASLSESSRRPQRQSLGVIANIMLPGCTYDLFPWPSLRYQHTQAIRTRLGELYSPSTANRHLAALRGVLRDSWRLGYMSAEDYHVAIDIKAIRGQKAKQAEKGRHLKMGELSALLSSCADGSPLGARDAALIALGYGCGLRRAELAALALADYDRENSTIIVRKGKGQKERVIPLGESTVDALHGWLDMRGNEPGALFLQILKSGRMVGAGLTDHGVYRILESRATVASVRAFAPHDLRRTYAGDLLDAGVDLSTVQKLMGHSNSNTTAGYDRRDARVKKDAVNKLYVPYVKTNKGGR